MCEGQNITTKEDIDFVISTIADNLGTMAMVNYPYPTSFITPLPAWPVNASCAAASRLYEDPEEDTDFNFKDIKRLARMNGVWQGGKCFNMSA